MRIKILCFIEILCFIDKLSSSWKPHIEILNKKHKRLCGRIYRIKRALPEHLYKQL